MATIYLDTKGLRELVRPGIVGWLALEVAVGDEVYHLHVRRAPDGASHTMPAEEETEMGLDEAAEVLAVVLKKLLGGGAA